MFSIKKKHKVQVLYHLCHNPSHNEIIERIELNSVGANIASTYLQELFRTKTEKILDKTPLENELKQIGIVALKDFFLEFPSAWEELKRKISKHKEEKVGVPGKYILNNSKEDHILPVFLRLGRKDNMGDSIEASFREEILNNPAVLQLSSREPSILDTSHGNLRLLDERKRVEFLEHLICHGIQKNVDEYILNYDTPIKEILPEIKHYLKSIFDVEFGDFPKKIKTARDLSRFLAVKIWNDNENGLESKKGWLFVKAFSAWGGYSQMLVHRKMAEEKLEKVPEILEKLSVTILTSNDTNRKNDGIEKYTCGLTIDGIDTIFDLEFRVKSMRSILLKLWESEDYNNIDALRDILGMAIVFPDSTDDRIKEKVIVNFSQLMANKGYVLKNKGFLGEESLKVLKKELGSKEKRPLGKVVNSTKGKTSNQFKNASISGFTTIFGEALGMEVQFHEEASYKYWMDDHYVYDPLKVVSAWGRGSWFVTPKQLLHIVKKEIPENIRETIIKKLPQQIIIDYFNSGRIFAFKGETGDIYFSPAGQVDNFKEKFPSLTAIQKGDKELVDFIGTLSL